jgi:hypothetical protein
MGWSTDGTGLLDMGMGVLEIGMVGAGMVGLVGILVGDLL